ncbi:ubiquinone biosynthesis monooxygenase COQ6, mitochondrial-like [Actinia tenebrosa]|uniref:Ubiquinone biosynthesis monooxygenase COQ6, mitochondrial-like n=1 Tax=Actinia tenebrosa TaxID=6105 RepID=A0A6P8HBQ5_ACTTE|nr:ubiquinone biosynthesis monooxygenase COQ6, mitochondrial-like [Actinia tenebrosa]
MFAVLRRSARNFGIQSCSIRRIRTSASKRKDDFYDVTIVGGGMVGGSLACALGMESSLSELKVLVLEAGPDKHYVLPAKYENRVSSITPGSKSLLESLGAWDHICNMRMKPYKRMHVWDACGDGHIAFDTSQDVSSKTEMAYIIENSVITAALDKQLKQLDQNVEVKYNARIKNVIPPDPVWSMDKPEHNPWAGVELDDGSVIYSRLLVGADGVRSTVRGVMDTKYLTWSYGQFGVVATLELGEITENIVAWQKFLPTGPMALLPLSENMSSLVWTTTTEHAKTLVNLPEDAFIDAVNNGFWEDLDRSPLVETASKIGQAISSLFQPGGTLSGTQIPPSASKLVEGSRAMFPLGLGHSSHYVQPRIALVGCYTYKKAVGMGFMRLFDYIEGANNKSVKIPMTAPVLNQIQPAQGPYCKNNFTVNFFVPFNLQANPIPPTSKDVFISSMPAMCAYVKTYSGFGSNTDDILKNAAALAEALSKDRLGDTYHKEYYYYAGYDSPFKLFDRTNDVCLSLPKNTQITYISTEKSSSGCKPVDKDTAAKRKQLEASIRAQVAAEEKAYRIVEQLVLENSISDDYLLEIGNYITPSHYSDIIEERGNVAHLQEYETERQRAVVPMIVATDLLNRLFSTSSILPVAARTAGLLATNALMPLKEQIISFARN